VTGGSKGLGGSASRFAREGAKGRALGSHAATWTRRSTSSAPDGLAAWAYSFDVTDVDRVLEAAAKVKETSVTVDVLATNAGFVCGGPFLDVSAEEHQKTMDVNFQPPTCGP